MAAYLLINTQTGLIENNVEWDGDTSKWSPPEGYETMLVGTQYPEIIWQFDEELWDWVQHETTGVGDIGETFDGTKFIQPKPPIPPQPVSANNEPEIPQ